MKVCDEKEGSRTLVSFWSFSDRVYAFAGLSPGSFF